MSYASELQRLPEIWRWATSDPDIRGLRHLVHRLADGPLFVVGSGGSFAACALAARLHQQATGWPATAITPLEYIRAPRSRGGVLLLSASGKNTDIQAAAKHALSTANGPVAAICFRRESPLSAMIEPTNAEALYSVDLPLGKDGFLATGSLIATMVLVCRAWDVPEAPTTLPALVDLSASGNGLPDQRVLIALASGWAMPAGFDIESRWGEAGLGTVMLVDPRNFAHGRHQGLARLAADTGILALSTPADEEVISSPLSLFPSTHPIYRLRSTLDGAWGAIELTLQTMVLAGHVGQRKGFDPGRPGVPEFGRKLYHQKLPRAVIVSPPGAADVALARKLGPRVWASASADEHAELRNAYVSWVRQVAETRIGGLVVDYDGTVCSAAHRYENKLPPNVAARLTRLLRAGMEIGIATGRGDSVWESLKHSLPQELWPRITLGLYNGGVLFRLDEPFPSTTPDNVLQRVAQAFFSENPLRLGLKVRVKDLQITVEADDSTGELQQTRRRVCALLAQGKAPIDGIKVVCSGHSLDIVPAWSGKRRVVNLVRSRLKDPDLGVLRLGDQGDTDGNDYELLDDLLGISVDRVSASLSGCWNPLPAGVSGTLGLQWLLDALKPADAGGFTLDLETPR